MSTGSKRTALKPPAIIVVGEVVKLRETIGGLITAPYSVSDAGHQGKEQASTLSKMLSERGALPVELPQFHRTTYRITKNLNRTSWNLAQYQWIIFTSVNGVEAVLRGQLRCNEAGLPSLHGLKIAAIGPATA